MPEPHKRAYRYPTDKTAYHVQNWREYDKSLRDCGDITLWISQEAIDAWTPPHNGKRGAQPLYADIAIETALSMRRLFDLPLRQTEGFLAGLRIAQSDAGTRSSAVLSGQLTEVFMGAMLYLLDLCNKASAGRSRRPHAVVSSRI